MIAAALTPIMVDRLFERDCPSHYEIHDANGEFTFLDLLGWAGVGIYRDEPGERSGFSWLFTRAD